MTPLTVFLLLLFLPIGPAQADTRLPYLAVTGPCELVFPRDHGPHPGYRTEWWYYTGNLRSEDGKQYGFQLTFFRSQVTPPGSEKSWPAPASEWRTQQLYLAHMAVSDLSRRQFHHAEKLARGALGLAGAKVSAESDTIFLNDWEASIGQDYHELKANSESIGLHLSAVPLKPLVLHGQGGYSRKGPRPEQASCYFSYTRLQIRGEIRLEGTTIPVSGLAWMDHEFSSAPLDDDLVGWDWFSLQFENESELMIYLLRDRKGGHSIQSAGTFVTPEGEPIHLTHEAMITEILEKWKSSRSGAEYPSKWRIKVPSLEIDVLVQPNIADQELHTPGSTRITYWEGSVSAKGIVKGASVRGDGYMELTGYDEPLDSRL
jgi:predicted secreted hydrolase